MLIGVDWGGTKIEAVAMSEDGVEHFRERRDTDPDIFVFGGGMSNVDELYQRLPGEILQYTFSAVFTTPIVKSVHGDSSGVRGAAWLWAEA